MDYILGIGVDSQENRKDVEEMFFHVFSALLDALLLRSQVCILVCVRKERLLS